MIKSTVKSSPDAILFDWDNTLVNNWDPIFISYNETLKKLGLKKKSKEETLKNAKYSLRETFPNLFKEDWRKARKIFYKTFKKIHLQKIKPLPKVEKVLKIIIKKKFHVVLLVIKIAIYYVKKSISFDGKNIFMS